MTTFGALAITSQRLVQPLQFLGCTTTSRTISIKAVGDLVMLSDFPGAPRTHGTDTRMFQGIKDHLSGADILLGNLEGPITGNITPCKDTSLKNVYAFRYPRGTEPVRKDTGFSLLHVANNHSQDFCPAGLAETKKRLAMTGLESVGEAGRIIYMQRKGTTIAFIGFHYNKVFNDLYDTAKALLLLREAKRNASIVLISLHAGAEGPQAAHTEDKEELFLGEHRGNIVRFAHMMVDNGADGLIGFGPHVLKGMEIYKGKPIAYSLGNFIGYGGLLSRSGPSGISVILELSFKTDGTFRCGTLVPVVLDQQGFPVHDPQRQGIQLIKQLSEKDFPSTTPRISPEGTIEPR